MGVSKKGNEYWEGTEGEIVLYIGSDEERRKNMLTYLCAYYTVINWAAGGVNSAY